ncbi:hypothetical protein ACIBO4_39995 [Streptomyces sp. NPDC050149]|uniref:hypothetical protein n=1 Tax=Streptomyces sp. NPDC050149 TaxID=3365603 RepID=UPI00378F4215
MHLLTAALHGSQTAIAQRQMSAKSNEIPAPTPLPVRFDLRGVGAMLRTCGSALEDA